MLPRNLLSKSFYHIIKHNTRRYVTESKPNQKIIEFLQRCKEEHLQKNATPYTIRTWSNAIKTVSNVTCSIKLDDDTSKLSGLGVAPRKALDEFLQTLALAQGTSSEDIAAQQMALKELQLVPKIGRAKAQTLVNAGCRSIEQLRNVERFFSLLSPVQRVGVKYMSQLENDVTRAQAEEVGAFCVKHLPPEYEVIPVGPYRRGAEVIKHFHIMVLHPKHVYVPVPTVPAPGSEATKQVRAKRGSIDSWHDTPLHTEILPALEESGLIAESIAMSVDFWRGIIRLPADEKGMRTNFARREAIKNFEGDYREMVINLVPQRSRGAALLNFTGDEEFIREVRMKASRLGMYFNEYGLWRWYANRDLEGNQDKEKGFWSLLKVSTEEGILEELGMQYIPPTRRNFKFILKSSSARPSPKQRISK